jgi:hypothetical protein
MTARCAETLGGNSELAHQACKMSNFDRDPVSVASREVHGPGFGMGTLALVALLGLGAGTVLGGVIMPFLRSSPPDQSQSQKLEAAQETNRALLFSMYPQTIYAAIIEGGEPISTGMSVEQYLTELEVRSAQTGLSASKQVERKGDNVEISYTFSEKGEDATRTFPQSKIKLDHAKTLVLSFVSGPVPGTIALQSARVDGRARGAGASFVDFVKLGAITPQLGASQFFTARGVFEIKPTGTGVGVFLDGVLVYPAPKPKPGPILAFPGSKPEPLPLTSVLPRRMALQSYQPAVGALKDRLILVASNSVTDSCTAKAVILDAKRGSVIELPEPLRSSTVTVTNAKGALILTGFCVAPTQPDQAQNAVTPQQAPDTPKVEVRLSARYDLETGALTWQRETVTIAPPVAISTVDSAPQIGASTPWRAQSDTRLASPLVGGGALVSVACRPGGGTSIALSGLPAPADGQAASIRFGSNGGSAIAQMRWRASAGGYELDGAGRPNEARAILERLRAGGMLTVSGAGGSKPVPAPGRNQIDQLVARCGTAATAGTGVVAASPLPVRAPPNASAAPKPKAQAPRAPSVAPTAIRAKPETKPPVKARPTNSQPPKTSVQPARTAPTAPKPKAQASQPSPAPKMKKPETPNQ